MSSVGTVGERAPLITDHAAPYICVNARVPGFVPRFKIISNERYFNKDAFIKDFDQLPLSIVFAFNEPDSQVDTLNPLPWMSSLQRTKVPAPRLKSPDVTKLQRDNGVLPTIATEKKMTNSHDRIIVTLEMS